ncbi:MAG: ATP-binding cassette domain-containing protein [Gammaproteobacteria bacterium]
MIRVDGLEKRFGEVRAVQHVSFSAADGEITGLLGPNGAGKSTTLRILATVLKPDAGNAQIDGIDVVRYPVEVRHRMGVLPHGAGLYPHLTGRENIRYFGRLAGLAGDALEARLGELTELLDLGDFQDRPAKGYSQGQRTRIALGRAMVHEPANLILDEPSSGLDVMATRSLRQLLADLKARGICILFSTHVMQEVAAVCDRIVVIAHGRVVARGTPDEIRHATGVADLEEAFVRAIGESPE